MELKDIKKINIRELKALGLLVPTVIIIGALILNIALWKSSSSLLKKNGKINIELSKARNEISKFKDKAKVESSLISEISAINSQLSSIKEKFFKDTEDIFINLNNFAKTSKISFSSIEPKNQETASIPYSKDLYAELPVSLKLTCDYFQLIAFLEKIESSNKPFTISNIEIKADSANIWNHNISLEIKAPLLLYNASK